MSLTNESKTALICGINGQDGSLLAQLLIKKGYHVYGTSRDVQGSRLENLHRLGIQSQCKLLSMQPEDFRSVYMAIKNSQPDEIYYLSGQSSVGLSFEQPAETIQSIAIGTLNMLEACRMSDKEIKLYNAGSSECFGDTDGKAANESTPFHPRSPYAVAKVSAYWLVNNYREAYNMYACTGILFNHESTLRPSRFVTQKIIHAAKSIANGSSQKLSLGNMDIQRDWGWATEYVDAMWRMLQQEKPRDLVIATGKTYALEDFVSAAFGHYNLDWRKHVTQSTEFYRPTDILISASDPSNAEKFLGWKAKFDMHDVVKKMINEELN